MWIFIIGDYPDSGFHADGGIYRVSTADLIEATSITSGKNY
jgi:hypothetical protein